MFFFKQKTAYEMRISDWSSDVCSSDLEEIGEGPDRAVHQRIGRDAHDRQRHREDEPDDQRPEHELEGEGKAVEVEPVVLEDRAEIHGDRKSTRLNSSH